VQSLKNQTSSSIVIIHFQPLELYPPVCNLLDYLTKNSKDKIVVITTENRRDIQLPLYRNISKQILIKRTPAIVSTSSLRLWHYLFFYLKGLQILLKYQPDSILYFDTISSWAALMYKKIKAKVRLLAHYHEYCSPQEYAANMFLVKLMHKQEAKMYSDSYHWISQTNEVRLQKMIRDNHLENVGQAVFHTMPNYPSRYWARRKTNYGTSEKLRLVYVGSLGYDTTYLQELTQWVVKNKIQFTLDLYSHNIDEKASAFLASLSADNIQFHGTVNYPGLPEVLANYDIGLVIYKPVSDNWIQNAPNKVFEYLACGLDVWFSKTMTYAKKLSTEDTFPKIIPVDFEKLDEFDFEKAVSREGLSYKESNFFYENVYHEILTSMSES
jgi:hypothetical protein